MMVNTALPQFSTLAPESIEPTLRKLLEENRKEIDTLLQANTTYTWGNLLAPLEALEDRLHNMWSPVSHLNSVKNSPKLREAYHRCLPLLSEYSTEMGHNKKLFHAIQSIADNPHFETLDAGQKMTIKNSLRDFRLAGVDLPEEDKKRFSALKKALTEATTKFSENVLDATQGWTHLVTDEALLSGLPKHAIALAKQAAEQKQKKGWLFTLEIPSYLAVMTYADTRNLREKMYHAYVTRASDQGPCAKKWNNTEVMQNILTLRRDIASLLGFKHYAALSLATKMAHDDQEVLDFLHSLIDAAHGQAQKELDELRHFANTTDDLNELAPWDIAYYSEKRQQHLYGLSQEELRPYFPENHVLTGLFDITHRLFGITLKEETGIDTWHKDVRFFSIYDNQNTLRGHLYVDLYARKNKRGGAWMDECRIRHKREDGTLQHPIAYLTCNFNAPLGNEPALFTHDDVLTLFHELGHCLQHLLTTVDYTSVAGINGIPWDAVELPSQFMENFCWEKEVIATLSSHYQTGETLPDELFNRMRAGKNFQAAMQMLRQLEFALFDFKLHMSFDPKKENQIQKLLDDIREKVSVTPHVDYNRFQHSFSHIFAGGYAAGYYSYKWAEVLSSDAYSLFEERGIFDAKTGEAFMHCILEPGGTEEPLTLFKAFRGRAPSINALLTHSGLR